MEKPEESNFGLIGKNISYSFSRAYFEKKFKQLNVPFTYRNFDLQDLSELTEVWSTPNLKGCNVTIPYKQAIIPHLDRLTSEAHAVGAVNCIICKEGEKIGANTDAYGFEHSFKTQLHPSDKKAIVLGANGGAAKAVLYTFSKMGIQTLRIGRQSSDEIDKTFEQLKSSDITECSIIVNCTPLGTYPNELEKPLIPYTAITDQHYLYDLVYRPSETAFLKEGKSKGARIQNGTAMLEAQAEKSWELWNSL